MSTSGIAVPPETWAHFQNPLFGIADLRLPEGITLQTSKEGSKDHILVGETDNPARIRIEIRLGYDDAHVASHLNYAETLASSDDGDLHKTIQRMADVDFGIAIGDDVSRGCVISFAECEAIGTEPEIPAETTYMAVVKSPFGHGLFIQIACAPKSTDTITQTATAIIGSLKWVDRRTVVKDVSSLLAGSWVATTPYPYRPYPDCTSHDRRTFHYAPNGTYTAEHIVEHVTKSGKVKDSETTFVFPGSWKAYQSPDKSVQLLKRGMNDEVQTIKFVDGEDKFEIERSKVVYIRVGSTAEKQIGTKKDSSGFLRKVKLMFK